MSTDTFPLVALAWTLADAGCAVLFTALSVVVPSALVGYTPGALGTPTLVLGGLFVYLKLSEALLPSVVTVAEKPSHERPRGSEGGLSLAEGEGAVD